MISLSFVRWIVPFHFLLRFKIFPHHRSVSFPSSSKMSNFSLRSFFTGCCGKMDGVSPPTQSRIRVAPNPCSPWKLSLNSTPPLSPEDLSLNLIGSNLRIFTVAELKSITCNFSRSNLIGEGGFGPVYKGLIEDTHLTGLKAQTVAVKRLNLEGLQGHKEWLAEVIYLGQLEHQHLVKLIGYCYEDEHRLLVYEFMEHGSLENQLFKSFLATLPWSTRLKIAIGAAKGLTFLHEAQNPVIYRDFKASNILLDSDYSVKLSDFGLAKDGPEGDETHVSTRVMGTPGYAAPDYIMSGHLTAKSDVYSFGVVLLELLTGRRSIDKTRPKREQDLIEWARPCLKSQQKLTRVMDPSLDGQYSAKAAQKAAELAYQCLNQYPRSRPHMRTVVEILGPLMDLDDVPIGPFVYMVTAEDDCDDETMSRKNNKHKHDPSTPTPVYGNSAKYQQRRG